MKTTWMFLLATLASTWMVHADEPKNFCYQGCSAREQEIWDQFEASEFVTTTASTPAVYSGECFHTGYGYNNEIAQTGVALLAPGGARRNSEDLYFSGQFSFFSGSDPYQDWTIDKARQTFQNHGERDNSLVYRDGKSGEVNFSSKDTIWMYWMRSSIDQQKMYVIGMWGHSHYVYCEWNRHAE